MIDCAIAASVELVAFVEGWESCRLTAYRDGGDVWTIGWGRTYDVTCGDTCTQAEADAWLVGALEEYGEALKSYMTREPTQQQFDALLSLSFNAGARAIGKAGIMSLFNHGEDAECADRFLQWSKDNGRVVHGLLKRRRAERAIYKFADYSGRP